jgi:hypothetical protein
MVPWLNPQQVSFTQLILEQDPHRILRDRFVDRYMDDYGGAPFYWQVGLEHAEWYCPCLPEGAIMSPYQHFNQNQARPVVRQDQPLTDWQRIHMARMGWAAERVRQLIETVLRYQRRDADGRALGYDIPEDPIWSLGEWVFAPPGDFRSDEERYAHLRRVMYLVTAIQMGAPRELRQLIFRLLLPNPGFRVHNDLYPDENGRFDNPGYDVTPRDFSLMTGHHTVHPSNPVRYTYLWYPYPRDQVIREPIQDFQDLVNGQVGQVVTHRVRLDLHDWLNEAELTLHQERQERQQQQQDDDGW